MRLLRVWWRVLRHVNLRGYIYIWANALAVVLSLPLITLPAAHAGLVYMSLQAQTKPHADLNDFWQAFKDNLRRGVVVFVLHMLIIGINFFNLYSIRYQPGLEAVVLRLLWIILILLWLSLQFYVWTLFYEMEHPSLAGAFRNAGLMLLRHPFFTVAIWFTLIPVVLISLLLPPLILLLTFSVLAAFSVAATLDNLRITGYDNPEHYRPIDAPESDSVS